MIITFITILAWIGTVVGLASAVATTWASIDYNKPDGLLKLTDDMKGQTRTFRTGRWWILAIVSIAWLIATFVA